MRKNNVVNVKVELRPGESQDRLLKRFLKKTKKTGILEEYLDKVSHFRTKSQKRRAKRLKNKYFKQRFQR